MLAWLSESAELLRGAFPVFNRRCGGRFYGFPCQRAGLQFGKYHHLEETVNPDTVNRECTRETSSAALGCRDVLPDGAARRWR